MERRLNLTRGRRLAGREPLPPRVGSRLARLLVALGVAVPLWGSAPGVVAAAPAAHTCGHFLSKGDDVTVLDRGPVSCKEATSIIHAFWSGTGVTMHGTSDATGYYTIKAWPGWHCFQAAGSGDCVKHKATASYEVKGKF